MTAIQQMQADADRFYTRFLTFQNTIKQLDPHQQIGKHLELFRDAELFDELIEKVDAAFKSNAFSKHKLYEVIEQVSAADELLEKIQTQGKIALEVCGLSEDIQKAFEKYRSEYSTSNVGSLEERVAILAREENLNFGLRKAVRELQMGLQQLTQNPSSSIFIIQTEEQIQAEINEDNEVNAFADQLEKLMKKMINPCENFEMVVEFYEEAEAYCLQKTEFLVSANHNKMNKVLEDLSECMLARIDPIQSIQ